jgi:hypothetical protein
MREFGKHKNKKNKKKYIFKKSLRKAPPLAPRV